MNTKKKKFSQSSFKGIGARVAEKGSLPCIGAGAEVGAENDVGIKLTGVATVVGALGFVGEPIRAASMDPCLLGSNTILGKERERFDFV